MLGDDVDISVSTMWGAKGVTADNVYIVGLVDEAIPGAKRDEYPGTDLDFVEVAGRFLSVPGDERDGCALIEQFDRRDKSLHRDL